MGQCWPTCDAAIQAFVLSFVHLITDVLAERVQGVYLHGSLATGSYYPPKSDLDLLAVVQTNLPADLARDLNHCIARLAETRPTIGSIEFSVITADTARWVPRPMEYELHYSAAWHDRIKNDEVTYGTPQVDPDLQAHLFCIAHRGICLWGAPIRDTFGEVAWSDFLEAIVQDFYEIIADESILERPYYGILNICRVFQALVGQDHYPFSKDEGGEWGLAYFPSAYHTLIHKALQVYHTTRAVDENTQATGGVYWDRQSLLSFRDYAKEVFAALYSQNGYRGKL